MREAGEGANDPDEWPLVPGNRLQTIINDPSNWQVPSEGKVTYWAAATAEGEAAYRQASEATDGPWIEAPVPITSETHDGFVHDGPERAAGRDPGFWGYVRWSFWGAWGHPDRRLWWRRR